MTHNILKIIVTHYLLTDSSNIIEFWTKYLSYLQKTNIHDSNLTKIVSFTKMAYMVNDKRKFYSKNIKQQAIFETIAIKSYSHYNLKQSQYLSRLITRLKAFQSPLKSEYTQIIFFNLFAHNLRRLLRKSNQTIKWKNPCPQSKQSTWVNIHRRDVCRGILIL